MQDDPHEHIDGDAVTDEPEATDPVQAGLEQFQRAALEAVRAGRRMLDAAETILQDPRATDAVVRSVGDLARTAAEAVAGFAARPTAPDRDDAPDDPSGDDPSDGFERISVG